MRANATPLLQFGSGDVTGSAREIIIRACRAVAATWLDQNPLGLYDTVMAPPRPARLNIRSEFVRQRTDELVKRTGMTATRIIEEALAHYVPPVADEVLPPGLVRKGRILVATGGRPVTVEEVQASIDETREGIRD